MIQNENSASLKKNSFSTLFNKKKKNIKVFINSSIQYGHKSKDWNPKMAPYIFKEKENQHILDLVKTSKLLFRAGYFLQKIAEKNGKFLFVGTNKICSTIVANVAGKSNSYYINYRWIGGLLTNWVTVQKQIVVYKNLLSNNSTNNYESKKEKIFEQKKIEKLKKLFDGIKNMQNIPDVVIFTNQSKEYLAIQECIRLGIPTICIVDTNGDPDLNCYLIPANDDSRASIKYILNYLNSKIISGYKLFIMNKK
jgi:small subunit ribosomal protein S2